MTAAARPQSTVPRNMKQPITRNIDDEGFLAPERRDMAKAHTAAAAMEITCRIDVFIFTKNATGRYTLSNR